MKKVILVSLAVVFVGQLSFAQRSFRREASLFKIGMNMNYFSAGVPGENHPRIGLNLGISPTIPIRKNSYFKPEFSFSMKGGRIDYGQSFNAYNGDIVYRLNYLEFPMLIGFKPGRLLSLEAGPYGAIEVGGSFDFQGTFFSGFGTFNRNDIEDFDYGLVFGVRLGPLGIRYYHGFQEISSSAVTEEFLGSTASNRTVQIYFQRTRKRR